MVTHVSTVSDTAVLRQAVLNTSNSLELLREAVSNSVDADARRIDISLTNAGGEMWDLVVQDDGTGMAEAHMKAFFNTGETVKDFVSPSGEYLAIGEKGLGSKTSFVASSIVVESRRRDSPSQLLIGEMTDPLASLRAGAMPTYSIEVDPPGWSPALVGTGTRIMLRNVHIATFNGVQTTDAARIAARVMHYLRTMCATGTVKNRHAASAHVKASVMNVGTIPDVTVEVTSSTGHSLLGPESGTYPVPAANVAPTGGPVSNGVAENSKLFCDVNDFSRSRTISVQGQTTTVHYDGTVIIAGDHVRATMLEHELSRGLTHKSQMGVHLCKDFIPLRANNPLSHRLLDGEFYYEFKVFLNCQAFQLNADRNVITNEDSDEIAWIWDDFKANVWPSVKAKAAPFRAMKDAEDGAIEAHRRTAAAAALKAGYATSPAITATKPGASVRFVKLPKKEADVSHLLAMMVEAGHWDAELSPITKFGQYIDDSTDILVEDSDQTPLLVEVELRLPNLFRHKHPMASYDLVVVWELGGLANGSTETAPWGSNGTDVVVTLVSDPVLGTHHVKWGTHLKPVLVLRDIL